MSMNFLMYSMLLSGGFLLVATVLFHLVESWLKLRKALPAALVEPVTIAWVLTNFIAEAVFYVVIPTLAYAFFYFILPFSGARAGVAATLFAFTLGAVPLLMSISLRMRLPMPYLLFLLLTHLIKLAGCLTIIGVYYAT